MRGRGIMTWAGLSAAAVFGFVLVYLWLVDRFLKRPAPSEAIVRTSRSRRDVFIGKAYWCLPFVHRVARVSLSHFKLEIGCAARDGILSGDAIPIRLLVWCHLRVEASEEGVRQALRALGGDDDGNLSAELLRDRGTPLVEPRLIAALRAVVATGEMMRMLRERNELAAAVSAAVAADLGRDGLALASLTIIEFSRDSTRELSAAGRETAMRTVLASERAAQAPGGVQAGRSEGARSTQIADGGENKA